MDQLPSSSIRCHVPRTSCTFCSNIFFHSIHHSFISVN